MYGGGISLVGSLIIMCGIDDGDVVVHLTLQDRLQISVSNKVVHNSTILMLTLYTFDTHVEYQGPCVL